MEEILASIRKIISEDSTEATPEAAAAPVEAEADVLELTQEVHDEAPAPAIIAAAPPVPEPIHEAVPEPEPQPDNDVVFQSIEETAMSSEAHAAPAHEGIFSEKTRKALEDSFASIPAAKPEMPAPVHADAPAASMPDGASVQAVFEKAVRDGFGPVLHNWLGDNSDAVVEKLKPLVREWMDEHFPALLEGAVRAEVERVARARH
jgi:cell pole-organizing protein PopZ